MKSKITKRNGFSIVEVMIAIGLMSIVGLMLTTMLSTSSKMVKTTQTADDILNYTVDIKSLLANVDSCTATFAGQTLSGGPADATATILKEVTVVPPVPPSTVVTTSTYERFKVGEPLDASNSIRIQKYSFDEATNQGTIKNHEYSANHAILRVTYNRGTNTYAQTVIRDIPMWIKRSGTTLESCRAIFNDDQIWKRSSTEYTNIYYDAVTGDPTRGNVSIGAPGFVDNLQAVHLNEYGLAVSKDKAVNASMNSLATDWQVGTDAALINQTNLIVGSKTAALNKASIINKDGLTIGDGVNSVAYTSTIAQPTNACFEPAIDNSCTLAMQGLTANTARYELNGLKITNNGGLLSANPNGIAGGSANGSFTINSTGAFFSGANGSGDVQGCQSALSGSGGNCQNISNGAFFSTTSFAIGSSDSYLAGGPGGIVAQSNAGGMALTPSEIHILPNGTSPITVQQQGPGADPVQAGAFGAVLTATRLFVGSGAGGYVQASTAEGGLAVGVAGEKAVYYVRGVNYGNSFMIKQTAGGANTPGLPSSGGVTFLGSKVTADEKFEISSPKGVDISSALSVDLKSTTTTTIDGNNSTTIKSNGPVTINGGGGATGLSFNDMTISGNALNLTGTSVKLDAPGITLSGFAVMLNSVAVTVSNNLNITGAITGVNGIQGSGNISGFSNISANSVTTTSDRRLKTNIQLVDNSLDKILNLNGVTFNWNDPKKSQDRQIGLIAQDVQANFPEAVLEDQNGFLAVNYSGLVGQLVESIKSIYQKLESYIAKVEELINQFQAMQQRQAELEKIVMSQNQKILELEAKLNAKSVK